MLADSLEVGAVLVHKLIHAAHPDAGHRGAFKRAALALGLTGRMTATTPGDQLRHDLVALTERIGQPNPRRRPGQCAARLRRCGESISTYPPAITVPSRSRSRWNVSSTREELSRNFVGLDGASPCPSGTSSQGHWAELTECQTRASHRAQQGVPHHEWQPARKRLMWMHVHHPSAVR